MQHTEPVIWLICGQEDKADCLELKQALLDRARVLILSPGQQDFVDLSFGANGDLLGALETCPADLRPAACINMLVDQPYGLDCLPCPVLGYNGAPGLNGQGLKPGNDLAGELMQAVAKGYTPQWLPYVQINLPLKDLLGKYRPLIEAAPVNLEVGFDGPTLDRLTPDDIAQARGLLEGRRVTAHLPFMNLAPGSPDALVAELAMQRISHAAELALEFGAEQAVVHLGYDPRFYRNLEEFAERIANNFRPLVRRLNESGCRLALENVFEPGPATLLTVLEALQNEPNLGLCLDVGHVYAFSQTSLAEWWQAVSAHLIELHLHDNDGRDDHHLPVGWSRVDWKLLHDGIKGLKHKVVLTMEPHTEPHLWASFRGLEKVWGSPQELLNP